MLGPYTFVWVDALTFKVREGRMVNVHALLATAVDAESRRPSQPAKQAELPVLSGPHGHLD